MYRLFGLSTLIITTLTLVIFFSLDNNSSSDNLLNKVNAVNNQWVNYKGTIEHDNKMMQSQFIPYNADEDYTLNNDAYVSYYKGENFIKTKLHEGTNSELQTLEEADGVILSFNKENKNGIKLVTID